MHINVLTIYFLLLALNLSVTVRANPESDDELEADGYYWKDYTGVIPKDALPGGINCHGKVTYIGQVLHENQLIPAKIDPEEKKVTYEWGYREYVADANIKILCTPNSEQFEWFNTGNHDINTAKDKNFLVAGSEPNNPNITLLVGRKLIDCELSVGKVVFTKGQSTLNTTKDGKGTQHGTFEVLVYSPANKLKSVQQDNKSSGCKRNSTIIIKFYN